MHLPCQLRGRCSHDEHNIRLIPTLGADDLSARRAVGIVAMGRGQATPASTSTCTFGPVSFLISAGTTATRVSSEVV